MSTIKMNSAFFNLELSSLLSNSTLDVKTVCRWTIYAYCQAETSAWKGALSSVIERFDGRLVFLSDVPYARTFHHCPMQNFSTIADNANINLIIPLQLVNTDAEMWPVNEHATESVVINST